ncbi:transcriptional regulator [Sphaerisporangium rufum]|uniref:Transcriptional regulator n=1 Tax=Sphaerisporangium rufum TaxID=1381558 RepID=A0A919V2Z2_9ACTN|nr:helix-turn-helix transcriptional regulator [Sphaerisporangium rufum]GII80232.1 transcriptional regulator [Sphaerisporangium rufum]
MTGSPTVKRRRLSAELIRLRDEAGMTHDDVCRHLEWSRGRLTHMEQNRWTRPDVSNVRLLLDLYKVTDPARREAILNLARQSRERGWWQSYKDIFRGSLPGFEAEATQVRAYEIAFVPGLLQTAGYANAIFRAGQVLRDAETECARLVESRLARQAILDRDDPPQLWAVIDEAALRKLVGGVRVMAEQLGRIIEMAKRPNITIQVLPDSAGAHVAMACGFVILDFPHEMDPSLVYLETPTDSLFLERPEEVQAYTLIHNHVVAAALSTEDSISFMTDLIDRLSSH